MKKPLNPSTALKRAGCYLLTVVGCVLTAVVTIRLAPPARAQSSPTPTCSPTPEPTPIQDCTANTNAPCQSSPCPAPTYPPQELPHATPIPESYQPHDASGNLLPTVLEWRIFPPTPNEPPNHKGPIVVLLHEGGFYTGNIFSRRLADPIADLAAAGYYVFVVAYPLAPCGLVKGQPCHTDSSSGRPPQQTDAVKTFIRAARADSHYDGFLAVVGGSAGGSHAAFIAFDVSTTSVWPFWNSGGNDDRPDAIVCLSGAYDFTDRTAEHYPPVPGDPVPRFKDLVENYTGTCVQIDPAGGPDQLKVCPVGVLQPFTTGRPFKPMYFINSQYDPMPFHQIVDVQCALQRVGVSSSAYQVWTICNSEEHAFEYWRSGDGQANPVTIGTRVINFLNAHR